jgi:hypothetical protein
VVYSSSPDTNQTTAWASVNPAIEPSSEPFLVDESILVCCKAGVNHGRDKGAFRTPMVPNNLQHTALKLHGGVNTDFADLKKEFHCKHRLPFGKTGIAMKSL